MKQILLLISVLPSFALPLSAQIRQTGTSIKPVGDQVVYKTTFHLGGVNLRSNGRQVYTPVLEGKNGETALFRSLMVNGRRQHLSYLRNGSRNYPDALEVQHEKGADERVDYISNVAYEPWMDDATWRLNTDTCGCGNLAGNNPGESQPLDFHPERGLCYTFVSPMTDTDDPVLTLSGKAFLDYPVNRTELHPNYRNNPRELQKIIATIDTVRHNDKVSITAIGIHGYASPEGSWDNNVRLAKGRAATLKDYVRQLYKFDENLFTVDSTPEDWDGLDSLLSASNIDHKSEILQIVRDRSLAPDPRNEKIKAEYPTEYRYILDTWYPALRHSDYTVAYKIRPMSDEEAAELLYTQPQLLSLAKLYRIAKLYPEGSDKYNYAYEMAARLYPSDPVANLNAANIAMKKGDLTEAQRCLLKAGTSAEATQARGILALLQHRYAEARTLLTEAKNQGLTTADKNLDILDKMADE